MFVSNLPWELDRFGVKGIFQKLGQITDVYLPAARARGQRRRFGFIRFKEVAAAKRSLQNFQGAIIRGKTIHVNWAKPKRHTATGIRLQQQSKDIIKRQLEFQRFGGGRMKAFKKEW